MYCGLLRRGLLLYVRRDCRWGVVARLDAGARRGHDGRRRHVSGRLAIAFFRRCGWLPLLLVDRRRRRLPCGRRLSPASAVHGRSLTCIPQGATRYLAVIVPGAILTRSAAVLRLAHAGADSLVRARRRAIEVDRREEGTDRLGVGESEQVGKEEEEKEKARTPCHLGNRRGDQRLSSKDDSIQSFTLAAYDTYEH